MRSRSASAAATGASHQTGLSPDQHPPQHPHHIRQFHSSSPRPFDLQPPAAVQDPAANASVGLGIADLSPYPQQPADNSRAEQHQYAVVDGLPADPVLTSGADFPLFAPAQADDDPFTGAIFGDGRSMAASQPQPTPPHMLGPESHHQSPHGSPSFSPHQLAAAASGSHSRQTSLGPQAAFMPPGLDWSSAQFQGHRRSPSEYSDNSVAPSPHMVSSDSFDPVDQHPSPLVQPQDSGLYPELLGLNSFSISDPTGAHSPSQHRSPSHSPAISPRIIPQQPADTPSSAGNFILDSYGLAQATGEAFPQLPSHQPSPDPGHMSQMVAPPSINIHYAPTSARPLPEGLGQAPRSLNEEGLVPPERGRPRASRPRAVTDPYNTGGSSRSAPGSLAPSPPPGDLLRSDTSRSLSPLDRQSAAGPNGSQRRRHSSATMPENNTMALRLADPRYQADIEQAGGGSSSRRQQKHPANFACSLCTKRFTRAYNLRSHLRTHTDERPFVCTVCGKAFARQHDRKRHEGLHSGEKKFVCKGDLKSGEATWGCGRRFARADALGRHFRSEAGRVCIKPLLDEELIERQKIWSQQQIQIQMQAQAVHVQQPPMGYPMDATGNYILPAALLAQYPALSLSMLQE